MIDPSEQKIKTNPETLSIIISKVYLIVKYINILMPGKELNFRFSESQCAALLPLNL